MGRRETNWKRKKSQNKQLEENSLEKGKLEKERLNKEKMDEKILKNKRMGQRKLEKERLDIKKDETRKNIKKNIRIAANNILIREDDKLIFCPTCYTFSVEFLVAQNKWYCKKCKYDTYSVGFF